MKIYGLIGRSLAHSFSKEYFDKKFQKIGIDAEYKNFEFESIEEVRSSIEKRSDIYGLNVTIPYKQAIIPYLDELDDIAKEIGAVNTISIQNGVWKGYNSDYYGFKTSLRPFLTNKHERALILGSGGASLAIKYALKTMQIPFYVVSREKSSGDLAYDELNENVIKACKFIINCTPLGMYPNSSSFPDIPYDFIGSDHLIYDLVYNPLKTKFMEFAENNGAMVMNGIDMLKLQAEKSWEIWNKVH